MPVAVKERLLELFDKNQQSYHDLVDFFLNPKIESDDKKRKATDFLKKEIQSLELDIDFPSQINEVDDWLITQNKAQCSQYQLYLEKRKKGAEREYFKNIAQAYEFLIKIAPVKRVDGSWLYSIIRYWNDPIFRDLIQIYLEELGLGGAKSNHVCVFDDLLLNLGLEHFILDLEDKYYHQPAIQLALAYAPSEFIPEIIGFNLGYEQLPLHLLISNYELNELGINAQYFNLHITIDNFDNGHANLSTKALEKIYTKFKDKKNFMNKVKVGFSLNNKGISSIQIIKNLNLEAMVVKILQRKALVGNMIHNERCKINQKTINQWLSTPNSVEEFLNVLIEKKWINLGKDPTESRFWQLINHEEGKMFGVFNTTEKQIIYDWIAAEHTQIKPFNKRSNFACSNSEDFVFSYFSDGTLEDIQHQLAQTNNMGMKINKILPYMAPHIHYSEIGLWCTKRFVDYLFPYLNQPTVSSAEIRLH